MNKEKIYNGKRVRFIGTSTEIDKAIALLDSAGLIGIEAKDRLVIQNIIDENNLKADILYDGNSVLSYKKYVNLFKKHNKSGRIDNMSNDFYEFLHLHCGDIAHYDKYGYISYYDGDFETVKREVIFRNNPPSWYSDLIRIYDTMREIVYGY